MAEKPAELLDRCLAVSDYRSEAARQNDDNGSSPQYVNVDSIEPWRLWILLSCVCVGIFVSLMDGTVVATALMDISRELGGFKQTQWIVLAYTLLEVGLCTTLARLSDVVGRRAVLCGCFAAFLCSSMACGASSTLAQLIGFRALQGTAGGGLFGTGVTVFLELMSLRRLVLSCTFLGSVVAAAGVLGPVLGGLLARYASWRYIFWINGPLTVVPGLLLFFLWPRGGLRPGAEILRLKHIDYLGALLIVAAPVLTIFILDEAAIGKFAWSSPVTIATLVVSTLLWICLFLWQREITQRPRFASILPQLPWAILVNRILIAALVHAILSSATLSAACFHIPIRAQIVNLRDAFLSAVLLLPVGGGVAAGATAAGLLSMGRNMTVATMTVSSLLQVAACVLLSYLPRSTDPGIAPKQWVYGALLGVSTGMSVGTSTLLTLLHAHPRHLAVMQGLMGQMRVFGGSIGIAISFTILHSRVSSTLQGAFSTELLEGFNRSPVAAVASLSPAQVLLVREAYILAFDTVMRACAGLSSLCCIISLFIYTRRPPSISGKVQEVIHYRQG